MTFQNVPDWAKDALGGSSANKNSENQASKPNTVSTIKVRDLQLQGKKAMGRKDIVDGSGKVIGKLFPSHFEEVAGFTEEDRANLLHILETVDKIWNFLQKHD